MKTYQKAFAGILLPLLFLLNSFTTFAQRSDRNITDKEKKEIIEKTVSVLKDRYIFAEKVTLIQKAIIEKLTKGQYSKFETAGEFLKNLNVDLEVLSNDRHVNVFFDPIAVKQIEASANDTATEAPLSPQFLERAMFENFMVRHVERLDGNVGYFKFNKFLDLRISKQTLVAAMDVLAHSSALIIDLRQNGGGYSTTTNFLLSYFLPDSTLIGDFSSRLDNTTRNIYTEYDPLIKKFPKDVPVYILASKRTSSAAEAFAYTLQAFKRAVIIGDTSNGEANPGHLFAINQEMYLMVPAFINRNAITKTNWQGIGVIPDIKISADKAMLTAQSMAYKQLAKNTPVADLKYSYEWMSLGREAEANPIKIPGKEMQAFAGTYADNRTITLENGILYYQRVGASEKKRLLILTPDTFTPEGYSFFRVRFIKDDNGRTTALEGMYDDGKKEVSKRIN